MTNIITRYYDSADQARSVAFELVARQRFSDKIVDVYDSAEGLTDALAADGVVDATVKAYQKKMSGGGAVLLVRADAKPLGVAQTTRRITAEMGAADMGDVTEEVFVKTFRSPSFRVLKDHRHFLTKRLGTKTDDRYHMADWPIPLISRRKPYSGAVIERHGRWADKPIGLLLSGKTRFGRFPFDLLIPGHNKYQAKFPFGHLVPHERRYSKFPFGFLAPHNIRYGKFPFGLLVPGHNRYQAKFPFGHLVPGGRRMATWPFPLLINGKERTNALITGEDRYQARFPFDHLVPHSVRYGKFPFGFLVSHSVRYGKFPFGFLVPHGKRYGRFPFDLLLPHDKRYAKFPFDYLVPGHKYMANFIFPHTDTNKA